MQMVYGLKNLFKIYYHQIQNYYLNIIMISQKKIEMVIESNLYQKYLKILNI